MKFNPIVLSALAVAASSPTISAAPFPAGSGYEGNNPDTITTPQPNENLSPRADIGQFARRASMRGGQRRSSGKHAKERPQGQEDKKVKRADLLASLAGSGAPPSAEQAGYQKQVESGLTGLGLGQLGGPVNGVLGAAGGLEGSVQGTLNGLGLGAVNGVARSVLGTVNGLEDSVQNTVKGLGLPEPLGSTVNNVLTTAKGVQGQALSQLSVVPQGSNGGGDSQDQALSNIQSQLNGLGLGGLTGLAGGALTPLNGIQNQLSGIGLGNAGVSGNGQSVPQVDASILTNILSTPGGLAALNNLTPAQLSSLGLGGLANTAAAPLSAVGGLQNQLQGLGLGLPNGLAVTPLANGLVNDPASALQVAQNALSDPQAIQKLLVTQAQEIAQLEQLVKEQNQKLASVAAGARVPVNRPNVPSDQARAALANTGLGDTAQVPGVFDSALFGNSKVALPQNGSNGDSDAPASDPSATTAAVPSNLDSSVISAWDSTASSVTASVPTSAPEVQPPQTFDPKAKVFVNVNPSRTAAVTNVVQTTSGWPWPMDASNLPPPVPAFTSWGVKMGQANASAKMREAAETLNSQSAVPTPTISQIASLTAEPTTSTPDRAPMPSPTGQTTTSASESDMRKRSKNPSKEQTGEDVSGSQDQSGTALNPMVPDVSSYLHDYVSSYEAPNSPSSFHSAVSNPGTPSLPSTSAVPSVSGGVEGPQVVLGDDRLQPPGSSQQKRESQGRLGDDTEEGNAEAADEDSSALQKRQDEEPEPEVDPAEDNSENDPPAPAEAEAAPEPEDDPVTVSDLPDTPVPLPKTLPAQPALHSKAHRVHKKDQNHPRENSGDKHHESKAYPATSPGGRPAMRRQQAFRPEHRENHKEKDAHIHVHVNSHGRAQQHKRDGGHGDEGEPELPVAPLADPAGTSQGGNAQKTADYFGGHAQMSPDCWEAMAAGKHMEHAQKRPPKLRRRNAMPDLANAASAGNLAAPPRVSAHPPSYQAAVGNLNDPDPEEEDEEGPTGKDGKKKSVSDKKKPKKEKEPKREREPVNREGDSERENSKKKGKQSVEESQSQIEEGADEDGDTDMRRAKLFRRRVMRKLSMKRWL
ncbi:hypothetical protein P389DRAFT_191826 [Cystobasidium minutum MCA 4210]|uniref:uncharacterized protein n=1 Tax=Cystobasidium minutum MCA 4210 TaxID=1397322 RepID=UPI0034CF891E|eukprot:jgi/Rhomi1/191826/gm1.40_g